MSEFEKFVNELPNTEESFDIHQELHKEEQSSEPEEGAPSSDGATDESVSSQDDKEIPFNRNPKIKRFIEKEIQKRLASIQPQSQVPQYVDSSRESEDVPEAWIAMWGDNEESRRAWKYQQKLLADVKEQAKSEVLSELEQQKMQESSEVDEYVNLIEDSLETIEDEYEVEITPKVREEFLDLVQRLSPKDAEGNVTSLADFREVWEIYQTSKTSKNPTVSRQKDLASRSMTKSSEAPSTPKGYEPGMGFDGVRRMMGLD